MKKLNIITRIGIIAMLINGCGNHTYEGNCKVTGVVQDYKKGDLQLYEITESKNYFISRVEIDDDGNFKVTFNAKEKSIYGIKYGTGFIYFINDVPELSLQTSESEFENYSTEGSPETEELKELVTTTKKMITEITLGEKLLVQKMVKTNGKYGSDPELLDLENKTDKNALEMRHYLVNYIDTVHDRLLAVGASNLLTMNEDYNYLELFSRKLERADISRRQKEDLKLELDKIKESFKAIAPLKKVKGFNIDGKPVEIKGFTGKHVLINVWASWCYLSRDQMPYIHEAYEKYKDDSRIEFINVAIDDDLNSWKSFLEKGGFMMKNNLCDTLGKDAAILKRFGLDYIPANFLLDTGGNIISSNLKDRDILFTIDSVLKNKK